MQALEGIRVLDLTHYVAGPYCTKIFAGLGAEVLKIERPGSGDGARIIGPFLKDEPNQETSALFLYLNTGKKSITLDLKTETGVQIVKTLIKDTDIVVENFRPGVMARLGLDYEVLRKINPGLLMTSISNFGQTGPYRDFKANELVEYAFTGLMYTTGDPDREPLKTAGKVTLYHAGTHAFIGTLVALLYKEAAGEGQYVDVSIHQCVTCPMGNIIVPYLSQGILVKRDGNYGYSRAAWGPYQCRDGYVGVLAGPDHRWPMLAKLVGRPELADAKYATRAARVTYRDEIDAIISPWLMEHDKRDIYHAAQALGMTFSYVATMQDLRESNQLKARGFFVDIEHPQAGKLTYPGAPFKMSETPWQASRAPLLGENNGEIYRQRLGLSKEELVRLRQAKVI
ncbi:CaiB/BaiF CoA transferase family protein [Chloroflexota bacterium]